MTRTVLVAGTASHAGKSTVAAGLCRLLARRDVAVAPYKAQNMSNNARAVPSPTAPDGWGEIGVSQYVQARAAEVRANTDVNPVLLKPRGGGESQLVLQGEAVGHYEAGSYYEDHWERAREAARDSYERLSRDCDVVVAEGAGSIAEINLHHRDLANVETARFADADVLLVADIERGGAFASLYGTLELMPDDLRERVVGTCVTKFRGDPDILRSGVEELEALTGVPFVGVVPYADTGLPEEDSVSLPPAGEARTVGDDGVAPARAVTVAVPRLPCISNFTDLEPLARTPGVRVRYVPSGADLSAADAVVLPGTKNTVDDLLALTEAGFGDEVRALADGDRPVVGLCGGFQMLGERIENADAEGTGDRRTVEGFGLLPVVTRFSTDKRVEGVSYELDGTGPLAGASGTVDGYEIHMGRSALTGAAHRPVGPESAAAGSVLGTYLHGLFENDAAREAFVDAVYAAAGGERERPPAVPDGHSPYEATADLLADSLDLSALDLPGD